MAAPSESRNTPHGIPDEERSVEHGSLKIIATDTFERPAQDTNEHPVQMLQLANSVMPSRLGHSLLNTSSLRPELLSQSDESPHRGPVLDAGFHTCRLSVTHLIRMFSLTLCIDVSRSVSGEIFVAASNQSKRVRVCNLVPERFPAYTFKWISESVQSVSQSVIDELLAFYFQSEYSVLPIVEERDIKYLFAHFSSDPSPNLVVFAIVYAVAALSAFSCQHGKDGEYYRDLGEWCYAKARNALLGERDDAQFEYLLACTLLVRPPILSHNSF